MPDFLLNYPQFLQAKLDKKIPSFLRIFFVFVLYLISVILFILQNKFYKLSLVFFIILFVLEIYFYSRRFSKTKNGQFQIDFSLAQSLASCRTFSISEIYENLLNNHEVKVFFEKIDLNTSIIKNQLALPQETLSAQELYNFFNECALVSQKKIIGPMDVLFLIIKRSSDFLNILNQAKISLRDVELIINWLDREKKYQKIDLFSLSPIGLSWSAGYTPLLDNFTKEVSKKDTQNWHEILHQELIQQIVVAIHNGRLPVLLGQVGSGRRGTILTLAKSIQTGKLSKYLNYRRVLEFQNEYFKAKFAEENLIKKVANKVLEEAILAGNIFLFITALDKTPEIIEVLNEFIGIKNFVAVASADLEKFEEILSKNKDFSSKVDKIFIRPPKKEEVLSVLMDFAWDRKIKISILGLKKILILAEKFDPYLNEPQRSINYLNEAVSYCVSNLTIGEKEIEEFFSFRFNISLGQLKYEEKQKLLNIKDLFHKEMVDQEEAIEKISAALKSARLGLSEAKRPIASFLFLGPTGVGKTTSAKVIAKVFFESEDFLVRLDMNEYSDAGAILRLINKEEGANSFIAYIKKNAQGVLLLDEIEKAHLNVKNALLQMLDEGYLKDSAGEKIFFNNYIIIATSNAASEFIRENISQLAFDSFYFKLKEYLLKKEIFAPEFLNRFDSVIAFKPLNQEDIINLTKMILKNFAQKIKEDRNININFKESFIINLAQKGFSPEWGAREIKRVIKSEVEPIIAQKIISGELKEGDSLTL